jgi:type IV pilus assembly protein PilY1
MRSYVLLGLLTTSALALGSSFSRPARAQNNAELPLPNVLLLVDSSGSMEWKSGADEFPTCDPSLSPAENGTSRWIDLVSVLTGSIEEYRCAAVDRTSPAFRDEFAYQGYAPPDFRYRTPHHRPVSGDCTPAPGTAWSSGSPYEFPADSIIFRRLDNPAEPCDFVQRHDGLLDVFSEQIRFGLMTFDTQPGPGTGITSYPDGVTGTWSYFVGDARVGKPADCTRDAEFEVGARNAAAPPWEGRMVAFGNPNLSATELNRRNQQIQQVLLATRPYGGTPIAGMLDDARGFLWDDASKDPLDSTQDFGPYKDPYILGKCRHNTIILLSDGEPNLELRPECAATPNDSGLPGHCPYETPQQIAETLATASVTRKTKTFVVGFALPEVNLNDGTPAKSCAELNPAVDCCGTDPNCTKYQHNTPLRACCILNEIALRGDTDRAHFVSSMEDLRKAVSKILSDEAGGTSSRTWPVFASAPGSSGSYRFYTSFYPRPFELWQGVIERQRFVCQPDSDGKQAAVAQDIERSEGDDFVWRVNSNDPGQRRIYSVKGSGNPIHSERSIRPLTSVTDSDGVGQYTGTQYGGSPSAFASGTEASAMNLSLTSRSCEGISTAVDCKNRYAKWLVGLDNGTDYHRCPTLASECNLVADVYHSTPAVVGAPSENLRDESYQLYAASRRQRPTVLYASTNDGFLHAFKVGPAPGETSEDPRSNNELWAFIPPAVLPDIPSQYPAAHNLLLDGAAVIREVVATEGSNGISFERVPRSSASSGDSGTLTWRMVLLQSFGANKGGYFALDVTDPDPTKPNGGPKFLWQLTTNAAGAPLFGRGGVTPLITTLYFDVEAGLNPKEVAVAVLPGGLGSTPSLPAGNTIGCPTQPDAEPLGTDPEGFGQRRAYVNCYPDTGREARSLTIVRLDTGEVIRSFRRSGDPTGGITRVTPAPLASPITGQPAAFPGSTGTLATQLYVGDADGVLWRVDVSSTNPAAWSMKRFFDAYGSQTNSAFDSGQPIPTAPKLSTDAAGHVTVAFATGDQEVFAAVTDMKTYVWSLTETLDDFGRYRPTVNWYRLFEDGNRVSGPLFLFNGALYFSTFRPSSSNDVACNSGKSAVWGMDYVIPLDASDRALGGLPALPGDQADSRVQFIDETSSLIDPGASIFGVTVAQLPTCADEVNVADYYYGTAQHTSISGVNTGQFQLIMHSGQAGESHGGQSKTTAINLPFPKVPPRIDSWAAIVEWP